MPLQADERSDVLRHLGYEIHGLASSNPTGGSLGYGGAGQRYFGTYGGLLGRLAQLAPVEEAKITGRAYSAIGFTGDHPHAGDTVTVSLSGGAFTSPLVKTIDAGDPPCTLVQLAYAISQAFAGDPTFVQTGMFAIADYGPAPFAQTQIPIPICSLIAPKGAAPITITTAFTGHTPPQIFANGILPAPYACIGGQKLYGYIPILNYLEGLLLGTASTMIYNRVQGSSGAAISYSNSQMEQRQDLLWAFRDELAQFLGMPKNKSVNGGCAIQY